MCWEQEWLLFLHVHTHLPRIPVHLILLVKPETVVIRPFESLHAIFLRSAPIRPQITPPGRRPLSSPSPIPSQPRRLPPTPPSPRDAASRLAAPQIHLPVPASPSRLVSLRHAACVTAAAACGVRDGGCRGTRRTVRARRPARRRTARRPGRLASMRPTAPTPPAPHDPAAAPPSDATTPRCCRSTSPCPRRFTLLFNVVQKAWRVSSILQADLKVAFDLSAVFTSDFIKLLPQNSFFY